METQGTGMSHYIAPMSDAQQMCKLVKQNLTDLQTRRDIDRNIVDKREKLVNNIKKIKSDHEKLITQLPSDETITEMQSNLSSLLEQAKIARNYANEQNKLAKDAKHTATCMTSDAEKMNDEFQEMRKQSNQSDTLWEMFENADKAHKKALEQLELAEQLRVDGFKSSSTAYNLEIQSEELEKKIRNLINEKDCHKYSIQYYPSHLASAEEKLAQYDATHPPVSRKAIFQLRQEQLQELQKIIANQMKHNTDELEQIEYQENAHNFLEYIEKSLQTLHSN